MLTRFLFKSFCTWVIFKPSHEKVWWGGFFCAGKNLFYEKVHYIPLHGYCNRCIFIHY